MSKHTPGPWTATFEDYRWVIDCQGEFGPKKALAVTAGFFPKHEANARLIAAAPDLLEALKLAHKALEAIADEMTVGERYTNAGQHLIDSLEPSRAAIAKATGEQS